MVKVVVIGSCYRCNMYVCIGSLFNQLVGCLSAG